MRNVTEGSTLGRIVPGFAMGSLTLALIGLTAVIGPIGVAAIVHPLVQLIFPLAAIATVLIAIPSSTARVAWGRLCLINGVMSIALAGASAQGGGHRSGLRIPPTSAPSIRRSNGGSDT
jgi:hypothetical protein